MSYWNGAEWVPEQPNPPQHAHRGRRLFGATLEATLIVALTFGLIAGTAFAAKGGNGGGKGGPGKPGGDGGSSTLAVRMFVYQNADGKPNWNDQVTFDVSTTATDKPWVRLDCYQGGAWVSTSSAGFFATYPWPANFTLSSGGWTGGAADCTATLYMTTSNGRSKTLTVLGLGVGA